MIETIKDTGRLVQAHLNRMEVAGATPTATQITALRAFMRELGAIGLAKFSAVYPFIGATAAAHALDLMGAYDMTWSGTVTHDSDGITGDGSTGYGDTGFDQSTDPKVGQDSIHCSLYLKQDPAVGGGRTMSVTESGGGGESNVIAVGRSVDNLDYVGFSATGLNNVSASSPPDGMFIGNRILSTHQDLWQNGTRTINGATNSTGVVAADVFFLARNNPAGSTDNYSDDTLAFASLGAGLSDGDIAILDSAVEAYQTALSRAA